MGFFPFQLDQTLMIDHLKKKDIYEIYSILISYKNIILSPKLGNSFKLKRPKAIFLNGLYGRASYKKKKNLDESYKLSLLVNIEALR